MTLLSSLAGDFFAAAVLFFGAGHCLLAVFFMSEPKRLRASLGYFLRMQDVLSALGLIILLL
ncbi:hypothetical protein IX84_07055 [Phaeodactylibacter xiamenensis]|uniref:Uncharacterized protein n=1 Tax=Phaeodactylibacter xiamenensis TaxID=1524460 RepID=A0A098S8L0_9BACT|nr:hypothetical protein IX84_07055 [Phaeodactylibacter xiamenensis]